MTELLDVDVTNPGQVFACLGVLELLDIISPGATGGFSEERTFQVEAGVDIRDVVASMKNASMISESRPGASPSDNGGKTSPVVVSGAFGSITLDPWLTPDHSRTATGLKLWAGRVGTLDLLKGMQAILAIPEPNVLSKLFLQGVAGTPSGLDPRSATSKSDLGFSYNSHNLKPLVYPAVDLFAMLGLEGARPLERTGGLSYAYSLWETPLSPLVARAVLSGRLPDLASTRWAYAVESRGLAGTYKYLSIARPTEART